ncbi:uncharacterized protein [Lolium perenne]|uniref:uncharacterized protein n=1 Tax=Lolium perenne TaxID=4522 RepID=UPI0021F55BD7|nr:trihelix transcription factor ENAP1-like [Lolium perenne]
MSTPGARGYWSDGETSALVEAWGQLHVGRIRGPVRDAEWRQVCSAVNAHRAAAGHRFDRSIAQCQWRMYSFKSQYKKELAKGQPTSGWRHFAQLRTILAGPDDGLPPSFAAKMPAASVVKEEAMVEDVEEKEEEAMVEEVEEKEEASGGASGSVGRKTVPAKRHFSSLEDILDRSGGPPPGFPPRMPATAKKAKKEEVKDEHGAPSADWLPGAVVTKLAEMYWSVEIQRLRVEMERLRVAKETMAMERERERRAAKVEDEKLGETDEATMTD